MKITIITPNFNYGRFIGETIESVINQNYEDIEHIIVDDSSTDISKQIVKSYIEKYPDVVKLIIQEHKGQTAAINNGFRNVSGDIIGWINSDDMYHKNIFKSISEIFERYPEINIVFGNVDVVDYNGQYVYKMRHLRFNYNRAVFLGFANSITSNGIFWRKSLMDKIGYMDESLVCNMDGEYFCRLTFGANVRKIQGTIAKHRKNITMASVNYKNWGMQIQLEREKEFVISYNNLLLSKSVLLKNKHILRMYYELNSIVNKTIRLYSLRKYLELSTYNSNKRRATN